MVTQPRRIAVVNLYKRLAKGLKGKVGMRMGHGVREESSNTKIYFVTTGYLVKLMAHHPEALNSITHIIIDEVHERSLDSDLICLLTRQKLVNLPNNSTRVVLMSATVNSDLYASYFHDNVIMKRPPSAISGMLRSLFTYIKSSQLSDLFYCDSWHEAFSCRHFLYRRYERAIQMSFTNCD
jgi:hypothetical protein